MGVWVSGYVRNDRRKRAAYPSRNARIENRNGEAACCIVYNAEQRVASFVCKSGNFSKNFPV